jgi:LysR family transcriptional activator of glutamate synthase operon
METRHMREFTVLAQGCNVGEAATRLLISQSALSKHIKSMEAELGVPLFDRMGKGMVLNEYGKLFLLYAKQLVMLEDHYRKDVHSKLHDADHVIVIGTEYRITKLLTDFRQKNNDYLLSSIEGNDLGEIRELLRSGECDLAFLMNTEDSAREFISIPYVTDAVVAVLYSSHPLAGRRTVSLEELKDDDFVMVRPGATHTDLCLEMCQKAGFTPKIVMTASRGHEVVDLVREELGVSLLLGRLVAAIEAEGIVTAELTPRIPVEVSVCHRRDAELSSGAKLFLQYVAESTT